MAYPAPLAKTFVLRARRETILLVATATALTCGLSATIHSHRVGSRSDPVPQQAWAGGLAEIAPQAVALTAPPPMTSASFVVSRAELELPHASVRALVKLHGCDGSLCSARPIAAPVPASRPVADSAAPAPHPVKPAAAHHEKPGFLARLNPLNHLPDAATFRRPFAVASDTVSGWFKHF